MARKQIAQTRPSGTTATTFIQEDRPWTVDLVMVTNTGAVSADVSLYHDADGTTYDTSTAILYTISVAVGEVYMIEFAAPIRNIDRSGSLGVQASVADTLTITAFGEVEGERQ